MGILLTQEEIDKIAYDTKDEGVLKNWGLQITMDTMVDRLLKAQLQKVAKWLVDLPTDGWDKWHFYHKELADKILKEIE